MVRQLEGGREGGREGGGREGGGGGGGEGERCQPDIEVVNKKIRLLSPVPNAQPS